MNKTKKNECNKNKFVIRVEGKHAFQRGDTFETFEEVAYRLHAHTSESLVYYWIRDSRLVKFAHTKVSRKIDEKLQYYSIKFSCIFGGQRFKSKANGLRPCKRQTRQIDCPAFISLRATKDGCKLEVIDVCNNHTHEISEQAVEELPQKRRPSQGLLEEIQELLLLNVDKKLIIEYVKQRENKNILKKDLFNMATHLRIGMHRTRSTEEQKSILLRITQTSTADDIQQAVLQTLLELNGNASELPSIYHATTKSNSHSIDVFDENTPDFTVLSPEIDLLNTTNDSKVHMDYEVLLNNRIVASFGDEENKSDGDSANNSLHDNKWNIEISDSRVVYKDFICGDNESFTCEELELRKEVVKQEDVHLSAPSSPVSNHPHDMVDDKEYFNDLILISPSGEMCSSDVSLCHVGHSGGEEITMDEYDVDNQTATNEDSPIMNETHDLTEPSVVNTTSPVKPTISCKSSKYLARRTRRVIINCRSCGANARLINMQISYLKQRRRKLAQETAVLKLKKQKLRAEIQAINDGLL